MEKVKIYLNEAQRGFVVCQSCGKSKKIEFAEGDNFRSGIVKCTCGNTFAVTFEKRKCYRKPIESYGKCFATAGPAEGVSIKLVDISQSGIRFIKIGGKPLQLNEKIRLSFLLGDSAIICSATVYNIDTEGIGAKFISLDEHIKKALGFFLLP
jgi:hypothetical protein